MLRGINVSGQKIVKMESLRASFEALGFSRVQTYVQSGNVIFETSKGLANNLSRKIREKISSDYGFSVPLILRTSGEMEKIVSDNPFLKERGIDHTRLHVTLLSEVPVKAALGRLDSLNGEPDQFRIKNQKCISIVLTDTVGPSCQILLSRSCWLLKRQRETGKP